MTATTHDLPGWERLRHGGLLLDGVRLQAIVRSGHVLAPLDAYTERKLRQRAGAMLDGAGAGSGDGGGSGVGGESGSADAGASGFVAFVLERVCGFDASTGAWARGRRAVTGETVKPRHLWTGRRGARLPVFLDGGKRLGVCAAEKSGGQSPTRRTRRAPRWAQRVRGRAISITFFRNKSHRRAQERSAAPAPGPHRPPQTPRAASLPAPGVLAH